LQQSLRTKKSKNCGVVVDAPYAGKPYELYLYPQKDHNIAGNDVQHHLFSQILAFFREALAPQTGK
jgi:hypothetical protein